MTDRDLLELIAKHVSRLTDDVSRLTDDVSELKEGQKKLEASMEKLDARQSKLEIIIENDIIPKIDILFEGHQQMKEQLDRIENKVSRHEEIILRSVK